jgi:site-specific DNA-cytosine methylase
MDWNKVQPREPSTTTVRDILEPNDSPAVVASVLTKSQWNKVQSLRDKDDIFMNLDKKAPTLISQYRRVGSVSSKFVATADGGGGRFLTPRECCRIMGFPEDFPCESNVPQFYTGIGNAVTPPVIAAIGRELIQSVQSKCKAR